MFVFWGLGNVAQFQLQHFHLCFLSFVLWLLTCGPTHPGSFLPLVLHYRKSVAHARTVENLQTVKSPTTAAEYSWTSVVFSFNILENTTLDSDLIPYLKDCKECMIFGS